MRTSEETKELAVALALAQAEIENPAADSVNTYYGSNYAKLAGGLNKLRGPLSKNGLALVQTVETEFKAPAFQGGPFAFVNILSRLMHGTGQFIETILQLPVVRQKKRKGAEGIVEDEAVTGIPTSQDFASAATYGRRIAGFALCGISQEDEDDDGNGASGKNGKPTTARPPAQAPVALPVQKVAPVNGKPMSARIRALNDAKALTPEEHKEIGTMIPKLAGADLEKFIGGWEKDVNERIAGKAVVA